MSIPFANVNVTFTTITPFTGNVDVSEGNPTAWQLQLTGQDGTQAWVTAQPDGINVEIGLALLGGSTPDTTVMTAWSELEEIVLMDIGLDTDSGF